MQQFKAFHLVAVLAMSTVLSAQTTRSSHRANRASTDTAFVQEAAQGGEAEVQMAQLALNKTSNQSVKELANKIADDHTKANEELKQIAIKGNVTWPPSIDAKDQAEYDKLKSLSGADFDRAYTTYEVQDHKKDIRTFQHETMHGMDPDVKHWASKNLPALQNHLSMAENARNSVK